MKKRRYIQWQTLTSGVSTTIVLVMLGMTILCALTARELSRSVRQSLTVTLVLSDEVADSTASALRDSLLAERWAKDITYISKEQALAEQTEAMGSDPSEFLGMNPFTALMEMNMVAEYACTDSLLWISKALREHGLVTDVVYQKDIVERLNRNIRSVGYVLLALAALLLMITLVLINNTVRLSVYSRRFLIHTMKLVGASWGFIRRPFMARAVWVGLVSGLVADAVLLCGVRALWAYDQQLAAFLPWQNVAVTAAAVVVCGLLLTLVCTHVSVGRYLSMRENELYG